MGFIAKRFSFNRIPCEKYGLRIYDIDGKRNDATPFASTGELITDVIPSKGQSLFYGRSFGKPLEFKLVFGLDPQVLSMNEYLDRYEINAIASWLTDQDQYQWLEIEQPDLEMIRYHCVIGELEPIQLSWLPWAFTAKITCDSPYGYRFPEKFHYMCSGTTNISLISRATVNHLYYPKMKIQLNGSNTISITNQSIKNTEFRLSDIYKSTSLTINIDNNSGIISANDGINMYQYFNFKWLPLRRGMNKIKVVGNCILDFICEFPANVGG